MLNVPIRLALVGYIFINVPNTSKIATPFEGTSTYKKSFVSSHAVSPNGSRMLNALNEKNITGKTNRRRAVSYGGESDV